MNQGTVSTVHLSEAGDPESINDRECLSNPTSTTEEEGKSSLELSTNEMNDFSTDPSKTHTRSVQGPCRLLQLPRELRDLIYEYALTEDGGLVSSGMKPRHLYAAGKDEQSEPNQLKLLSKQLYSETKGLPLLYNNLTFENFDHLEWFVENYCADALFRRVKEVTIKGLTDSERKSAASAIQRLSQDYPSLKFAVRTANCRWTEILKYAFRETPACLDDGTCSIDQNCVKRLSARLHELFFGEGVLLMDNVRLYPNDCFEVELRLSHDGFRKHPALDVWIVQFKKWVAEGF
jgi:hypothetical protein